MTPARRRALIAEAEQQAAYWRARAAEGDVTAAAKAERFGRAAKQAAASADDTT